MIDLVSNTVSEVLWLLMLFVTSFGLKLLKDLANSVENLNEHIVRLLEQINAHETRLNNHEARIGKLENDKPKKKNRVG